MKDAPPKTEPTDQEQDFLARMSHELRTPLNAIQGYAELLIESKPAYHEDVPDLQAILRATHRLQAFVEAVLDLNQLRMGKFELTPETFPIQPLVEDVERAVRDMAQKNKTEVHLEVAPIEVKTDRRMVRQILFNLANNAVRFTVRGKVAIRVREVENHFFEMVVADDGIGMTQAQLEAATEPFWQADPSTTRRYEGAGMGLAVCKGLAEAMGGDLEIESVFGKGARVTVVLPKKARFVSNADDVWDEPTVLLR